MATPKIKIYRLFKGYSSTNDNDIQGATNDELLPIKQKKLMPAEAYELVGVNSIENDILVPVKRLGFNNSTGVESGYEYSISDTSGKLVLPSNIFTKYLVVNKETMFIEVWKKINENEYSSTYLKGILISEEDQNEPVDSSYDYKIFYDTTAENWIIWFTAEGSSIQDTTYLLKNIWVYELEEKSLEHTLIYDQDDTLNLDVSNMNGEKRQLFYDTSNPDFLGVLVYDKTEDNQQGELISPVYYTVVKDGRIIFNPQVVKTTRNIIIKYQLFKKDLSSPYLFTSLKCKLYNGTPDGTSLNNLFVERVKRIHNNITFTKNQDGVYEFSDSSKENLEMLCGGIIVNHKTKPWRTVSTTGKVDTSSSSSSSSSSSLSDNTIVIDYYTDPTRGVFDLTSYINNAISKGDIDLNNVDYLLRGSFVSTYYYESSPTKTFVSDYQNWVTEHMRLNPDIFYGKKDYPGDEYIDSNNNTIQTPAIPCFVESGYTIRYRNGAVVFGEDKEDFDATSTEAESESKGKVRANFTYYAGLESVVNQKLDLDPNYVSGGFKYKALTDKEYPGSIGKRWVYRDDIQQFIGVSFLTKVKDPTTGKWTDVNLPDKSTIQSEKLTQVSFFEESNSSTSSSSSSSIGGTKSYNILPDEFLNTNYFKVENNLNDKLDIILRTNDSATIIGTINCSLNHDVYGLLNLDIIYPVIKIDEKISTSVEEQDGSYVSVNTVTIIDTMIESTLKIYNGEILLNENTDYTISRVESSNGLYEYIFRFNDDQIEKVNIYYNKNAVLTREENYQNITLTYYDNEYEQTIKFKLRAVDFFKDDESSYQCIVFSLNKISNLSL